MMVADNRYIMYIDPYTRTGGVWGADAIVQRLVEQSHIPRGLGVVGDRFFTTWNNLQWLWDR